MADINDTLAANLVELENLYIKSREAIALLEAYSRAQKTYLGSHNEMRNALDHIMRMAKDKDDADKFKKEFEGAKAHLLRAGYDAYELLCIDQILYVTKALDKYNETDIRLGFPEYYTDIRPAIENIRGETANLRATKKCGYLSGEDTFKYYFESAHKLLKYTQVITAKIPDIDIRYCERRKKETHVSITNWVLGVWGAIGTIVSIISLCLYFCNK